LFFFLCSSLFLLSFTLYHFFSLILTYTNYAVTTYHHVPFFFSTDLFTTQECIPMAGSIISSRWPGDARGKYRYPVERDSRQVPRRWGYPTTYPNGKSRRR
jgi:hypothetical protein